MKKLIIFFIILILTTNVNTYETKNNPKDLSKFGWKLPVAMTKDANPYKMQLYLTNDLKMIWVSNDIADNFGRIQRHPITSTNDFITHNLETIEPYTKLISYANVDFKHIKEKQKRNILEIINKDFCYKTYYTLKISYEDIINKKYDKKHVKDFSIEDVEIFKKENNVCILYNEDVINPYYNLQKSLNNLQSRGFKINKANKQFIETNKMKIKN